MTLLPSVQSATLLSSALTSQARSVEQLLVTCGRRPKRARVHALRVALRTLLATLELTSAAQSQPRPGVTRRLEKMLALLSPLRDVHVQRKTLARLEHAPEDSVALRKRLRRRQRELERRAGRRLSRFDADKLTRDLRGVARTLAMPAAEPRQRELVTSALQGELASRHLRVVRRQQARPLDDARHLHRLRLELKGYRYALDTLAPVLPAPARTLAEEVAQLQELLGQAHDAHVLSEAARRRAPKAKSIAAWLEARSAQAQTAAAEAVAKYSFEWPFGPPRAD